MQKLNPVKVVFYFAAIFIFFDGTGQNLVPNPSFESGAWANGNSGSVDLNTGPSNVFGTENAHTGVYYMGESMGRSPAGGSTDFREYIKNSLTTPLIAGNTYECSVWVSLSENYGSYACNSVGFVTTPTNPYYAFSNAPIPLTPVYATGTTLTNKVGWTQVYGTFVASSADSWVMVGNFNTQAGTNWTYVGPATGFYYGYYYMDDVCLGPPGACGIILPIELLSFEGKLINREVGLNWKTSTELNCLFFAIERSNNGKTFEKIGEVKAKGTTSEDQSYKFTDQTPLFGEISYYRLREFDLNGKSNYSGIVSVEVKGDLTTFINVYPVPSENNATLECNANDKESTIYIYDSKGRLVFQKALSGHYKTGLNDLPSGNYICILLDSDGKTISKKFIITGNN